MSLLLPGGARRKGEPVWVLVAIIGGWIGVRAATWEVIGIGPPADLGWGQSKPFNTAGRPASSPLPLTPFSGPSAGHDRQAPPGLSGMPLMRPAPLLPDAAARSLAMLVGGENAVGVAGGHELLWLAALARMPLAYGVAARADDAARAAVSLVSAIPVPDEARRSLAAQVRSAPVGAGDPRAPMLLNAPTVVDDGAAVLPRWSGDGWGLFRQGGNRASSGSVLLPSYGANQIGAVLRYRLAPASAWRPTVYTRAYAAMNGTGEREVAAGVSARPVPAVPVIAMAEGRVSRFAGGASHLRPAVALVSEVPPMMLPGAMRAETYVQGGYVGGTGATPFVDGQFRLEHIVRHTAHAELRVGGGVWGGAQKGAGRMDVGPTATVAFNTARAGAHLSVDWRLRVAGNARPGSGPAVTLAAGF